MSSRARWAERRLALFAILTAITVAAYGRIWWLGFTNYDDPAYVASNSQVLGGLGWPAVAWAFTTTTEANWHPLTWLSLMLDASIGGANPTVYHATNLLLHAANTLLLFLLLDRMTGFRGRSAFVAALFAVHPLHVESVAWIAERKDVLSTLFWLLTTAAYVRYAARLTLGRYALVLAAFALGLMAKPMLVTLPLVLLLLDVWPLGRWAASEAAASRARERAVAGARRVQPDPGPKAAGSASVGPPQTQEHASSSPPDPHDRHTSRDAPAGPARSMSRIFGGARVRLVLEKIPLLVLAAVSAGITLAVQRPAMRILEQLSFPERAANALISYAAYIVKMVAPVRLAIFYPHPLGIPPLRMLAAAALLLAGVSFAAARLARSRPWFAVGWAWYLVTLLPVVGLVQVGQQARADRYTYVPLIGLFLMVSWGAAELIERLLGRSQIWSAAAWTEHVAGARRGDDPVRHRQDPAAGGRPVAREAGAPSGSSRNAAAAGRSPTSADAERLLAADVARALAVEGAGPSSRSLPNRADRRGVPSPLDTRPIRVWLYDRVPEVLAALVLLVLTALTWVQVGTWRSGVTVFTHAIAVTRGNAFAHYELSTVLEELGDNEQAVVHLREALRIRPLYADAHFNLTHHLMRERKMEEVIALCREEEAEWPRDRRTLVNLGVLASLQGRTDEAVSRFSETLRLYPDAEDARHNLEAILSTKSEQALDQASEVLRRGGWAKLVEMSQGAGSSATSSGRGPVTGTSSSGPGAAPGTTSAKRGASSGATSAGPGATSSTTSSGPR